MYSGQPPALVKRNAAVCATVPTQNWPEYVSAPDKHFAWHDTGARIKTKFGGEAMVLNVTSQQWLDTSRAAGPSGGVAPDAIIRPPPPPLAAPRRRPVGFVKTMVGGGRESLLSSHHDPILGHRDRLLHLRLRLRRQLLRLLRGRGGVPRPELLPRRLMEGYADHEPVLSRKWSNELLPLVLSRKWSKKAVLQVLQK